MNTTIETYKPSGRFAPSTLLYTAGAIVAGGLLAWVYQALLTWIPFIYLELFLVGGFAFVLGVAGSLIVDMGHCRNKVVAALLGLLLGATALFASFWWGYRSAVSDNPDLAAEVLNTQYGFTAWVGDRVEGGWRIKNSTVNGWFVWLCWALEAAAVIGLPVVMMWSRAQEAYCENCNAWHEKQEAGTMGLKATDVQPMIDQGDLAQIFTLRALETEGETPASKIGFERFYCQSCPDQSFLTIKEVTWVKNRKGEMEEKSKTLVELAALTPDLADQFTARFLAPQRGPELSAA